MGGDAFRGFNRKLCDAENASLLANRLSRFIRSTINALAKADKVHEWYKSHECTVACVSYRTLCAVSVGIALCNC